MTLFPLTFLVDPIINLINKPYHKCEEMKHHYLGPALGVSHLGHRLGPPTREKLPNFGANIIYFLNFFGRYRKKN